MNKEYLSEMITKRINKYFEIKREHIRKNRWIKIKKVKLLNDTTVVCEFESSDTIEDVILEDFFAEYDRDITHVPKSILVIPALSNLCTIAWVLRANILLDELDLDFYQSLNTIKKSFQSLYPTIKFEGDIFPNKLVRNREYTKNKSLVLFSGGIDSTATFVRNRSEQPLLLTGWGPDINLKKETTWDHVKERMIFFSEKHQLEYSFVKSNMSVFFRRLPLTKKINRTSKTMLYWYPHIQHGIALLGLTAPLTYANGIEKVYIASSNSAEFPLPYGSHPTIENNTQWGETTCIYDGYEYNRQEKIMIIKDFIDMVDPDLQIRVCFISPTGENCSKCSKCKDTITGIVLEGLNPNKHGFSMDEQIFDSIRNNFESGRRKLTSGMYYRWIDIQRRAKTHLEQVPEEYKGFFEWLVEVDLEDFRSGN
ncbi:hypothetical protein [Rossellomorea aquimaris]|uniref:hypothetical protein n=1 Tax=Rossellomorea aquimaris TaxID=189382 RepID=UPI0007D05528|nr:hypothetical protein [Rossellomorea aquimaris]